VEVSHHQVVLQLAARVSQRIFSRGPGRRCCLPVRTQTRARVSCWPPAAGSPGRTVVQVASAAVVDANHLVSIGVAVAALDALGRFDGAWPGARDVLF